jgi:hypothetical protein
MEDLEQIFNGSPSEFGVMLAEFDRNVSIHGTRYPSPNYYGFPLGQLREDANPVYATLYKIAEDGKLGAECLKITAQKVPGGKSILRIHFYTGDNDGSSDGSEAFERWERLKAEMARQEWIEIQDTKSPGKEIATTDVISFEYQHDNTTTDQIDRALDDMSDRWNNKFPRPLWRVHCRPEDYGYAIAGNLWIPEDKRLDGKAVSDEDIVFGYFELTPRVLVGRYTITADWAKSFFELFYYYLKLYGLPERQVTILEVQPTKPSSDFISMLARFEQTLAVNSTSVNLLPGELDNLSRDELARGYKRCQFMRQGNITAGELMSFGIEQPTAPAANNSKLPPVEDPTDKRILEWVTDDPDIKDSEIAQRLGIKRQSVNTRRRALEKMGYKVR